MPRKRIPAKKPIAAESNREAAETISRIAEAIGHPLRVQILQELVKRPASAKIISESLEVPLGNVSYHLKQVLDDKLEVVTKVKERPIRGALETFYEIDADALVAIMQLPDLPKQFREALRGSTLIAFFVHALEAVAAEVRDDEEADFSLLGDWQFAQVDDIGWGEIQGVVREATSCVAAAILGSRQRLNGDEGMNAIFGVAAFPSLVGLPESE
ncbi:MAG TPA: winged helix-turn-helix domain-containing protein [Solirubrobacterales bacterium]|nr:winged helix-turn-helix domain-containing protein [Solirubrobacterales bacterium]